MASYCSLLYAGVFLPIVLLAYGVMPQRHRSKVLLAASYVFFWSVSGKLIVFLLASTLSLHHCGLWLSTVQDEQTAALAAAAREERRAVRARCRRRLRRVLAFALLLHIGTLLTLKYAAFFSTNLDRLLDALRLPVSVPVPAFVLPIGISFYHAASRRLSDRRIPRHRARGPQPGPSGVVPRLFPADHGRPDLSL